MRCSIIMSVSNDFSGLEPYDEDIRQVAWDYIEVRIQTLLYERDANKAART
jgi:hypothetical protein